MRGHVRWLSGARRWEPACLPGWGERKGITRELALSSDAETDPRGVQTGTAAVTAGLTQLSRRPRAPSPGRGAGRASLLRRTRPLRHPLSSPPGGAGPGAPMPPRRAASWCEHGRTCRQAEGPEGTPGTLLTCQRLKGPGRPGGGLQAGGGRDLRIYTPLGAAGGGSVRPAAARAPSPNPESDPGSAAFRSGSPLPERVQSGSPQEPAPPAARPRPWESETFDRQPPGQPGTPCTSRWTPLLIMGPPVANSATHPHPCSNGSSPGAPPD